MRKTFKESKVNHFPLLCSSSHKREGKRIDNKRRTSSQSSIEIGLIFRGMQYTQSCIATTHRRQAPSCNRSKALFMSLRVMLWVIYSSTLISFFMYFCTSQGT
uniref:Uncharacterized protein n=1 Tax=Opuntia streptacantha TaxID=393608 RepID=A0A7C8YJE6_OPUST